MSTQVHAPIRNASAAIREERAPVAEEPRWIECHLGRRPEPEIVIETGGRIGIRRRAEPFRRAGFVDPRLHVVDFADFAAAHDLGGALEVRAGALLQTDLHDALVAAGGLHHQAAFAHHIGYGLLHVDILVRVARRHGDERMPMIGRGDDHRVHRTVVQQLAEIGIGAGLAVGELVGGCEIRSDRRRRGPRSGLRAASGSRPDPCGPCRRSRSRRCRCGRWQRRRGLAGRARQSRQRLASAALLKRSRRFMGAPPRSGYLFYRRFAGPELRPPASMASGRRPISHPSDGSRLSVASSGSAGLT